MAAPNGTLTYYTTVTLNAPGSSNADATAIAAAFNGQIFPAVSSLAAAATASSAAVTIKWAQSGMRVPGALARDAVARQVAAMKASLNAPVTDIKDGTTIDLT